MIWLALALLLLSLGDAVRERRLRRQLTKARDDLARMTAICLMLLKAGVGRPE